MKTIIFAGGWGTRLGQLSELIPKPMVQIGGRPILWHIMKIYSHYGFNDFIILLGVKGQVIKEYFYNFQKINNDFSINLKNNEISYHNKLNDINWKVTLIDTGLNTLKGGRIKRIEKYLDDSINMLTYGDGVANINLKLLLKFHKKHNKMITVTGVRPSSLFGEFEEINGQVTSFSEKPKSAKSYINGGFMVFNKKLIDHLDQNCDFEFGPLEILAKAGEVMVYKHDGEWACMDHERDVENLNNLWYKSEAFWKIW